MKKITLALFSVVCFFGSVLSQPNITIQAPLGNSSSQLRAPNGTVDHTALKACYLIKKTELTALTGTLVTGLALDVLGGTGSTAVTGQFTVYLQNTPDVTYLKGTNFTTALTGMTQHFSGNITVPAGTGASVINIGCTPNFTYNPAQGGIYVAFVWQSAGPFAALTNPCTYNANLTTGGGLGALSSSSVLPAPNTMTVNDFRPAFLLTAVNEATNEITVNAVYAAGKVTKFEGAQTVTATIKNSSIGPLTGVTVTLNVTGANTFNNVQTLSTPLAGGATAVVLFPGFNPTANGLNTMSVSTSPDQNLNNNSVVWTQSVSCTDIAIHPPVSAGSYTSQGYGAGAATSGLIYVFRYTAPVSSNVTAVKLVIPSFANAANLNKNIYPVLLDASGSLIGQGNQVTITAPIMDIFTALSYTAPQALVAGNVYYIGISTTGNAYFPVGNTAFGAYPVPGYFSAPAGGGALTPLSYGFLSLAATMSYSATMLSASATKTIVCKKDGPNTVTLTAVGGTGTTFTWTPGGATASIVVTPSVVGTGGGVQVFNVTGTDGPSGCKTNNASITVSVSLCLGLASNNSNGYDIKLFPNPSVSGKSTITGLVGTNSITVYNTLGQVVFTQLVTEESTLIDLSAQPSGNYIVKITDSNSESRSIKVMNQN